MLRGPADVARPIAEPVLQQRCLMTCPKGKPPTTGMACQTRVPEELAGPRVAPGLAPMVLSIGRACSVGPYVDEVDRGGRRQSVRLVASPARWRSGASGQPGALTPLGRAPRGPVFSPALPRSLLAVPVHRGQQIAHTPRRGLREHPHGQLLPAVTRQPVLGWVAYAGPLASQPEGHVPFFW